MKNYLLLLLAFCCLSSFFACQKSNKDLIFIKKAKKKSYSPLDGYVYVPSASNEDSPLQGFYIKQTEITNKDYRVFLADLERKGDADALEVARIKSENWVVDNSPNAPFSNVYETHEAYDDYPVLNISYEAAQMYCQWLSELYQSQNGLKDVVFQLPSRQQWEYAARGGQDKSPFPWGYYLRNNEGQFLANFRRIHPAHLHYDHESNAWTVKEDLKDLKKSNKHLGYSAHITTPVRSFLPNNYGIYNIAGNASEMLQDGGTKGGSWGSSPYYLRIAAEDEFPNLQGEASKYVGFRPVGIITGKAKSLSYR